MTVPAQPIRIYHQSFTVLGNLPEYEQALREHCRRVARPETEVVLHGMHPRTYQTDYPGNDIKYAALQALHAQQFLLAALAAEERGFDAYAIATMPDPLLAECRSLVEIPVVGCGESAMLAAATLGRRFGVLLFIAEMAPRIALNAKAMGLSERFLEAGFVGFTFHDVLAAFADPAPLIERFRSAARAMIARGAEVLIPGEVPLNMLLARAGVAEVDGVPVVDALAATIKAAETAVDLRRSAGMRPHRHGLFGAMPPRGRVKELLEFYGLARLAPDNKG
jgi:Asp/Glu/hydantoin racemase